jgi:hypothetical protein
LFMFVEASQLMLKLLPGRGTLRVVAYEYKGTRIVVPGGYSRHIPINRTLTAFPASLSSLQHLHLMTLGRTGGLSKRRGIYFVACYCLNAGDCALKLDFAKGVCASKCHDKLARLMAASEPVPGGRSC